MTRILIIDDEAAVRAATKIALEVHGFDVATAADGRSGIDMACNGRFDLAIIDLFMPGMDGLKTTQAIHELNPGMPIIAASGFMLGDYCPTMPNFDSMAMEAGAVATLYKPFRPKELLHAVETALGAGALAKSM